MISLILIIYMFFWIFINKFMYKKSITLPTIITIIWCITLLLSMKGFFEIYIPDTIIVYYALLFLTVLNLTSIFFSAIIRKKNINTNYNINYQLLNFIIIICIIGLLFMCKESIYLLIKTKNFSVIRNSFINYESINMHSQVFLTITFIPIGKACYLISALDFIQKKKVTKSLVLSIIFSLLCVLLNGGRSILIFTVLVLLYGLYMKEKSIIKIINKNKKIIKFCSIILIAVLLISSQRTLSGGGIFKSIYVYFCGCFNLLGVYSKNGMLFSKDYLYGQELISGFAFPFIQILRYLFKFNILPGNYILAAEATSKYIQISPNTFINATPTTMFYAIRDFGILGLIIYPTVISFFYVYLNKKNNENILNKCNFTYFCVLCTLLNMSYQFETFQNVGVFLYMYIICLLFKRSKVN